MVRFKNRYLLVEIVPVDPSRGLGEYEAREGAGLSAASVASHLRQSIADNFGQVGAAVTAQSLSVKYCNATTGTVVVRAAREQLPLVWASLTLLTGAPPGEGRAAAAPTARWLWRVTHVAGTIRSAQRAAMRHAVTLLQQRMASAGGAEKDQCRKMIASCRRAIKSIEA